MAEETIYLCNFRVSVDGDWLCLKELTDVHVDLVPHQEEEGQLLLASAAYECLLSFLSILIDFTKNSGGHVSQDEINNYLRS